jgi:hypothetical protein
MTFYKTKYEFPAALHVRVLVLRKILVLEVVRHLKIYQYIKFHGPTLTGAKFAFTLGFLNISLFGMV